MLAAAGCNFKTCCSSAAGKHHATSGTSQAFTSTAAFQQFFKKCTALFIAKNCTPLPDRKILRKPSRVSEKGCWSQRPKATESPKVAPVSNRASSWPLSATSTEPRVTIQRLECSAFTSNPAKTTFEKQ